MTVYLYTIASVIYFQVFYFLQNMLSQMWIWSDSDEGDNLDIDELPPPIEDNLINVSTPW